MTLLPTLMSILDYLALLRFTIHFWFCFCLAFVTKRQTKQMPIAAKGSKLYIFTDLILEAQKMFYFDWPIFRTLLSELCFVITLYKHAYTCTCTNTYTHTKLSLPTTNTVYFSNIACGYFRYRQSLAFQKEPFGI